jgi:hypothetical protein
MKTFSGINISAQDLDTKVYTYRKIPLLVPEVGSFTNANIDLCILWFDNLI